MITAMQLMLSQNVSFIEKSCEFTPDCQLFGRKTFAETEDLVARNFLQDTGELMIELEMRNIHNLYECYMRVPKEGHQGNHRHNYHSDRMESTYFLYGLSDWSVSLFPDSSSTEADGSVAVQLQRHSSFDHLCCVRYRVILGDEGTFDSGDLEQILDASGVGEPFTVGASVSRPGARQVHAAREGGDDLRSVRVRGISERDEPVQKPSPSVRPRQAGLDARGGYERQVRGLQAVLHGHFSRA